jgi:hypothetical protein
MHTLNSNEEKTNISDQQVFSLILNKVFEQVSTEKDLNIIADNFAQFFNRTASEFVLDASQRDLYKALFLSGYFYKIFLNKNNVKFVKESN